MKFLFPGLSLLLLLSGCFSGPLSAPTPDPLPIEWRNAGNFRSAAPDRDLGRWWDSFEDPTLTRIIREGLAGSPDVASVAARVREARANRKATAAALFPTLDASTGSNTRYTKIDGVAGNSDTSYSAGLDASWQADLFGRNRNQALAAATDAKAAEENLNSVRASLAAEIAIAYTSLRTSEARLDVLQRNIATQQETWQIADWRKQAGEADALEAGQAETSLEQAKAAIPQVRQAIEQTRNLLARLCGREPGALDATLRRTSVKLPDPGRQLAIGIPADTLRQRPDVRAASWQVLSAAARNRAARAERFPSLNLSGSLGINALSAGKLSDPNTFTAGIISGISGPIFDAGRIQANIEASDAAIERALLDYRSSILTALSEVEDALIACRRSSERLATLEKATRLARETDRLARQRYEAGEIDFLSILETQRTLLALEDNLLATRSDRATAFIRLYQALGGGWSAGS